MAIDSNPVDRTFYYDKAELRSIIKAFKAMDEESIDQAKRVSNSLADYASKQIIEKANSLSKFQKGSSRVAEGVSISKTSKIGEMSFGFARQRFSGGSNTRELWIGLEFGTYQDRVRKRKSGNYIGYKQFPNRTPRFGGGSEGTFIYPTLRRIQPDLIRKWEEAFSQILKKWDD